MPTSPDSGLESLPRETKESIKHSKILNAFLFLFDKMLVYRAGIHKMFVKIANREDPDQEEAVCSESALFCLGLFGRQLNSSC